MQKPDPGTRARYDALMDVVRSRMTVRAFDPAFTVPREHYEMILEAARHSPSGANAQPWHFIVVRRPDLRRRIADALPHGEMAARAPLVLVVCGDVDRANDKVSSSVQVFPQSLSIAPDQSDRA